MKNYANTIIYKLFSKNADDFYIGHTTLNLEDRFKVHCYYTNKRDSKLYKYIREHGGIKDWEIETIEEFPCESLVEAKTREAFLIKELKSKLNSNVPNQNYVGWRKDNREKYNSYMRQYMNVYNENKKNKINWDKVCDIINLTVG